MINGIDLIPLFYVIVIVVWSLIHVFVIEKKEKLKNNNVVTMFAESSSSYMKGCNSNIEVLFCQMFKVATNETTTLH